MDVFTFAFLVTLVGCSIPLSKVWLNRRRGASDAELAAVTEQLERMKQRISALETIVTDEKFELHRELRRLEDVAAIEPQDRTRSG